MRLMALCVAALSLLMAGAPAWGQSPGPQGKTRFSSSLNPSVSSINIMKGRLGLEVSVDVGLQNTSTNRVYLMVAGDQRATLSDGHDLKLAEVIGASECRRHNSEQQVVRQCMDGRHYDLSDFSYIDPGGHLNISMRYALGRTDRGYQPAGSISFGLKLVVRSAYQPTDSAKGQGDPQNVTPPTLVLIPLPSTELHPGSS